MAQDRQPRAVGTAAEWRREPRTRTHIRVGVQTATCECRTLVLLDDLDLFEQSEHVVLECEGCASLWLRFVGAN